MRLKLFFPLLLCAVSACAQTATAPDRWSAYTSMLRTEVTSAEEKLQTKKPLPYGIAFATRMRGDTAQARAEIYFRNGAQIIIPLYEEDAENFSPSEVGLKIANVDLIIKSVYQLALMWDAEGKLRTKEQADAEWTEEDQLLAQRFTSVFKNTFIESQQDFENRGVPLHYACDLHMDGGRKTMIVSIIEANQWHGTQHTPFIQYSLDFLRSQKLSAVADIAVTTTIATFEHGEIPIP